MTKCTFCNSEIGIGTGKMYVKIDGRVLYFCGKKCEKNMLKLGRHPTKAKWTEHARKDKSDRLKQEKSAKK